MSETPNMPEYVSFGIAQWAPPQAPNAPRLVLDEGDTTPLTLARTTNSIDAMVDGLASYLSAWSVKHAGRTFRFGSALAGFATAEQRANYPSLVVTSLSPVLYAEDDDTELGTGIETVWLDEERRTGYSILGMTRTSLALEMWCNTRPDRAAAVALIEDALSPVEWMAGVALILPAYHSARARFSLTSMLYIDSDDMDARRYVVATATVDAVIPTIRVRGTRTPQAIRAEIDVEVA